MSSRRWRIAGIGFPVLLILAGLASYFCFPSLRLPADASQLQSLPGLQQVDAHRYDQEWFDAARVGRVDIRALARVRVRRQERPHDRHLHAVDPQRFELLQVLDRVLGRGVEQFAVVLQDRLLAVGPKRMGRQRARKRASGERRRQEPPPSSHQVADRRDSASDALRAAQRLSLRVATQRAKMIRSIAPASKNPGGPVSRRAEIRDNTLPSYRPKDGLCQDKRHRAARIAGQG